MNYLIMFLVLFIIIGLVVATSFSINHIDIKYPLNNDIRIVQLADLHLRTGEEKKFKDTIRIINKLKPKIVLFTGDLYDFGIVKTNVEQSTTELLKQINAPIKIAIYGNHDVHPDTKKSFKRTMINAGFYLLKNELMEVEGINFYAVDSMANNNYNPIEIPKDLPKNTIILSHEPDSFDDYKNHPNVSVQLSGHSHGGQVAIPFIGAIKTPEGSKKYWQKCYYENNSYLHVCYGIGNSQHNVRFYVRKHINVYTLSNK